MEYLLAQYIPTCPGVRLGILRLCLLEAHSPNLHVSHYQVFAVRAIIEVPVSPGEFT